MSRRYGRLAGAAAVVVATTLAPAGVAAADTPTNHAAAVAQPSVVYIEVHWRGWVRDTKTGEVFGGRTGYELTTRCSGFFAAPDGTIVAPAHCVDPGKDGVLPLFHAKVIDELAAAGRISTMDKGRKKLAATTALEGAKAKSPVIRDIFVQSGPAVVPASADDAMLAKVVSLTARNAGDVAILQVTEGRQPALEVASAPSAGTSVVLIGYPASSRTSSALLPSVTEGNLGGGIEVGELSGGVVVDRQGRVVGLVGASTEGGTTPAGGPKLAILPTTAITDQLDSADVDAGPGAADRNYRHGLDKFYDGYYSAAIKYFDATIAAIPGHGLANEFRAEAIDLRAKNGDATDWTTIGMFTAAGLIVVALLVWLVIGLLRRRRRDQEAPARMDEPVVGEPSGV
ncbi:MAG TPA: hypothetical protein VKE25_05715 [Actinomycetes bacterium]|nr:hypothetical protein [Actinomycetes bacterium]